jgi:signal transduction histidine kinase
MLVALATVVPITLLAVEWTLDLAAHQRSEVESLGRGVQELRASLERSLAGSLRALLAAEDARPVLHYTADTLLPPANGLPLRRSPTPLATAFGPAAPLAFFSTDANWSQRAEGAVGPVRCCFWLPHPELATLLPDDRDRRALYGVVDRRVRAWVETRGSSLFQWGWLATPEFREERSPQLALAAFVFDAETDPFLREENDELLQQLVSGLSGLDAPLLIGPCRAEVSEPESDRPQFLVVSRLVLPVDEAPLQEVGRVAGGLRQFHLTLAHVDAPLRLTLLQGATYALEPLLQSWARSWAQEQLGTAQSLEFGPSTRPTLGRIDLDLVQAAGLSAVGAPPGQAGLTPPSLPATLTIDPRGLQRRHRVEWIVLAVGLAVSAAVGGSLLAAGLKDLQRRLRQADRTSNFVAAVTHEFRTPLSTIALHAEMLLEGWTVDPEQRQEYYRRIANETTRLSRLVERILEQSQLSRGRTQAPAAEPELGDLNAAVKAVIPSLEAGAPGGLADLRFELADGLPPVLQSPEAIESIVTNLVENARKYAPARVGPEGVEPLLVRTGLAAGEVRLEVLDRGPGIPEAERERVFEAFYRIGNEATRTTTGTGLGLHLVQLQVQALGGRAEVLDRAGGGACLRVSLPAR